MNKYIFLLLASLFALAYSQAADSTNVTDENVFIYNKDSIYNAIQTIANKDRETLSVSEDLQNELKQKTISAKFENYNSDKLLDQLATIYGFEWFTYAGTLYITNKHYITKKANVFRANMSFLKSLLKEEGFPIDKFNYSEFPLLNQIVINGPEAYVELLLQKINYLKLEAPSQQFGVYYLKYASATDVSLNYNNTMVNSVLATPQNAQVTVPGVATILQSMLGNKDLQVSSQTAELMSNSPASNSQPKAATESATSSSGSANNNIQADPRLNAIIIRDTPENLAMYKNLIEKLDLPTPLITVELLIIEINDSKLKQEGVSWWASFKNGPSLGFNPGGLNNIKSTNGLVSAYGQISSGQTLVTNATQFLASVKYLEESGVAKTLAKPTLTTIDNIPATATVGQNSFMNPNVSSQQANSALQSITGISILPHVIVKRNSTSDQVKLTVALLDGELPQFGLNYPTMFQGSINSQAVLEENQSLLLASYNKTKEEVYENKVPILGDIPYLGWFFKNKVTAKYNATNLYLITPKIRWLNKEELKSFGAKNALNNTESGLNKIKNEDIAAIVNNHDQDFNSLAAAIQQQAPATNNKPSTNSLNSNSTSSQGWIRQDPNGRNYVIVGNGDTLYNISKRANLSPQQLMSLNKLASQEVVLGSKLYLN